MQRADEAETAIQTQLLFFDLEWAALDDARADELLATDGLENYRHHLATMRRYRPHLLSEPEEKVLTEKGITGSGAWARLFSELMSAVEVELPGHDEPVQLEVAASQLMRPDREARAAAAEAITDGPRPRPAHARLHLQHAGLRQGRRRPPAQLPELDLEPQPVQRGLRRVGRRARAGRAGQLRHPAALVQGQGRAARARPPLRLRPDGAGDHRGRAVRVGRGVLARARRLRVVLPRARRARARVLRRALDRRARAPGQARRRVLRLHRRRRCTPTCC